jgi:hypothetical protein
VKEWLECECSEMVGFGSVVKERLGMVKEWLECEWDEGVNVGLLKELGASARLLREDGGGGREKDPVGLVKDPVKEKVGLLCEE